ncbi:MAG: acyl-CoA dehydrogenase family protein [Deltaproteobacteria bacterium]|jgi:alkylation response protein AidB-like acyl-CoA dehydrogenase|nr:acyl-CoA dehydrogenase family protein [Deltaproteobacteria bacterium]MBW2529884.1 acyl-CoA dehydrogenase family protein [Deltaproteobacteria bacterium]
MANYFTDNDDLQFYFERGLDWEPLVKLTEYDYRAEGGFENATEAVAFYRQIMEMVGEFVAEQVAPQVATIDREGIHYENGEARLSDTQEEIFEQIKGLELHGMCIPRELGGMNCPTVMTHIQSEVFGRADSSVMGHHSFHGGIALAMLMYSIMEGSTEFDEENARIASTRFQEEIGEILRGEAWGAMDITEPDAGSDMAAIRAVGEQDENGNWFVTGNKIFITAGHGKYHFVIARTEKAPDKADAMAGLKGLSMFLVPCYEETPDGKRRRIVELDRVEEKIGHHGSVTASLNFERAPAHLIGERGDGFKLMLMLMNNARVGVGFECIGLCEAAYRLARDYAAERKSMGKTIDRHEIIADYLDEMRSTIQGLRAMAMHGAYHEEMAQKLNIKLAYFAPSDEIEKQKLVRQQKRHARKARRVTPLLKYLGAESAVLMARRCLQIHGGNGYTTEYGAEKLVRDALVMPIYEGTSQIQSLMAMKDTLGAIMKNPQGFVKRQAQARWRSVSAADPLERRVARIQALSAASQNALMTRTAAAKFRSVQHLPVTEWPKAFTKNWDPKRDFAFALLHAERLCQLLSDEVICELLLDQAKRHDDRREVLERYLERAEPRCRHLHDVITSSGTRLLESLSQAEGQSRETAS